MHPVVEHLRVRQGRPVPIPDGRRIALVLPGGVMAGIRGAGAMIALAELGLAHAFDLIVSQSAGFANASYLLADDTRLGTSIYYEDLAGRRFINPFRLWKVVDIPHLLDVMRRGKRLRTDRVLANQTELFVQLWNAGDRRREILEVHRFSAEAYFSLMHAATSLWFLNPGAATIGGPKYMDANTPLGDGSLVGAAFTHGASDVLVILNRRDQARGVREQSDRLFMIAPDPSWRLSRFETRPGPLKEACLQMGRRVKETFGFSEGISM